MIVGNAQLGSRRPARLMRCVAIVMTTLALCALTVPASAQSARERFQRGLELFEAERYDAALAEFEEAYRLRPNHHVLYNIARVYAARGDAVRAVDAFERYVREGDDELTADERASVEEEIATQRALIVTLIVTSVPSGTVSVDGVDVGQTPLRALQVTAGRHVLAVRGPAGDSMNREIQVAGGITQEEHFVLSDAPTALLRIRTSVPGAEIFVDGRSIGRAPVEPHTVAPGPHVVRVQRSGYESVEERVELEPNIERELMVTLEVRQDAARDDFGQLVIQLPASGITRVDGNEVGTTATLPSGRHRVEVEVAERLPFTEDVTLDAGQTLTLEPQLRWIPEAREQRIADARKRRRMGWIIAAGGVAVLGAGLGVVIWNEGPRRDNVDFANALGVCRTMFSGDTTALDDCAAIAAANADFVPSENNFDTTDEERFLEGQRLARIGTVGWVLAGVGAAVVGTGVVIALTAPSAERIDEDAWKLRVSLDGLSLSGTF